MELHNYNNKMNHHITESPEQLRNYQIPTANLVPWGCSAVKRKWFKLYRDFFGS